MREATAERPAINDGKSQDITEVRRELRSSGGPKPVNDSRGAAQLSAGTQGRVKQMTRVRLGTSLVIDRGEQHIVSCDLRRRGRKRGQDRINGLIESSARLEVPLSPATGRMLLGQVTLNFRFLSEIMRFKLHFA